MSDETNIEATDESTRHPVERLFPFVIKSRGLIVGRASLIHSKSKLHFVLVTDSVSDDVRAAVVEDFKRYPIVQHFTEADLERCFAVRGAKVIGFAKSGLAQSIYAELKEFRINKPVAVTPLLPKP